MRYGLFFSLNGRACSQVVAAAVGAAVCLVLPLLVAAPARATHLFGNVNGNPHTVGHANPNATITLDPEPVTPLHAASQRLLGALATQGFDADGADNNAATAGDNWTITEGDLSADSLKVEFYRAYSDVRPGVTCGTFVRAAETVHHTGGAAICLTYHPHVDKGDPVDIHWIQSILTNVPGDNKAADNTSFPGRTLYLDNFANPNGHPYYDPGFAANAGAFLDRPRRAIANVDWEADVYVVTGNLAARTLTIYDGARWGFEIKVPEPSSLVLFGVSLAGFTILRLVAGARRRPVRPAA